MRTNTLMSRFSLGLSFALAFILMPDASAQAKLEQVASISQPIGNMTFSADGRKFFSIHPFYKLPLRVAELTSATTFEPFPNLEWNTPRTTDDLYFDDVLGLRCDDRGYLWIMDMGTRTGKTPKLVQWDLANKRLERIYYIPAPASLETSQLNDFVVDTRRNHIYIADEDAARGGDGSRGALVDVDLKTGECRRLLEGDVSTIPARVPVVVKGKELQVPDKNKPGATRMLTIGNDGIATDKDYRWLYFGPMNGKSLYRVDLDKVIDRNLPAEALSKSVERYSDKINNGGISVDNDGNIYSTELEHHAVGMIDAKTRQYARFVSHPDLSWPDGVSYCPDGYMYVSDSQLDRSPLCNDGKSLNAPPYLLFRFKPLANGRAGQ